MTTYIALLRGINVGGNRKVSMTDLKEFALGIGLENPRTLLQSGNLVFGSKARSSKVLEQLLEKEADDRIGLQTNFLVRSARELETSIARNPLPEPAKRDPAHLLLMFLKSVPETKDVKELQAGITGRETVRADGAHLYIDYCDGIGTSRFTGAVIERKLKTRGTARNWNTVLKLAALARTD